MTAEWVGADTDQARVGQFVIASNVVRSVVEVTDQPWVGHQRSESEEEARARKKWKLLTNLGLVSDK